MPTFARRREENLPGGCERKRAKSTWGAGWVVGRRWIANRAPPAASRVSSSNPQPAGYVQDMALVRILVDGYSLLHRWPELANGWPRHSAAAREELIRRLTLYQDAIGTPITVFFDGGGAPTGTPAALSTREMEVLYSRRGKTADQMIERAVHRFSAYGEVLAVTDDHAEQETVLTLGGGVSSCGNFILAVQSTLGELSDDIQQHNRRERHKYQRRK
jgi:predicted RNA-binding protein with PIN domain